ncbi:MAG: sigma-70 family RNA polymerase sigma factor [Myxococcaceae bacterium]|nr:sigma-70 family RNA polymerase sigma factor [Myxococcaceae bacterium]
MCAAGPSRFPTTRWTLILAAGVSAQAREEALTQLMGVYWKPLYIFLRRRGLDAAAAEDAVQDVLLLVLERNALDKVRPERGRLRAYLKTVAQNYLINRHEQATAQKRGGAAKAVPIDTALAERLADVETADPDLAFERAWATALMGRAFARLREEYISGERQGPWEILETMFQPSAAVPGYRDLAKANGLSVPALKAFVHRARLRYRELVREEVEHTVENPAEIEGEMSALLEALA